MLLRVHMRACINDVLSCVCVSECGCGCANVSVRAQEYVHACAYVLVRVSSYARGSIFCVIMH